MLSSWSSRLLKRLSRKVRPRFDPINIGFLVGGAALGIAGCILGMFIPYRHPVSVTFSMFWWAFWLGLMGAYIGACAGELFYGRRDHSDVQ